MSKLTNVVDALKRKNYAVNGVNLIDDPDFKELLTFTMAAYGTGLINGAKRFAHNRRGSKYLGIFDKPFAEFVKEIEEKFEFKYRTYDENQFATLENTKRIVLSTGSAPTNLKD